ncbi:MAG: transposase family protein [Planctomycetota bacterium]|jgi:hypothetical protein|nr:MAG: transposase family protein [Planctomycetota bacterium]
MSVDSTVILMALTATMCGADVKRFVDARYDRFEKYIPMESGIHSHDTFRRIFPKLDTGEFLSAMHGWACGDKRHNMPTSKPLASA